MQNSDILCRIWNQVNNSAHHRIVIASKNVTVTVTTSRVGRQHDVAY